MHNSIFSKLSFWSLRNDSINLYMCSCQRFVEKHVKKTLLAEAFMGLGRNFELYFDIAAWPVFKPLVVVC